MNKQETVFKKLALATLIGLTVAGCAPEFDNPVKNMSYKSGNADFSTYVAVGDSLTAGYADGALYLDGQKHSYPALLAQSFAQAGGGSFTQPLVSDNNGGLLLGGNQIADTRLVLGLVDGNKAPKRLNATPTTDIASPVAPRPNNMGVPGAKSFHLAIPSPPFPGYGDISGVPTGTANPYFVRFASSASATVIGDAAAQQPSFFTLWIGNNDVLFYALAGGTGEDQTGNTPITPSGPDFSGYGPNDITDPTAFGLVYQSLVDALKAAGGKGVLITIPSVTDIPFFTTVPYNPLVLDQGTAAALDAAYAAYNAGLDAALAAGAPGLTQAEVNKRKIHFAAGQNPVVILDEDLTDLTGINPDLINMRQATSSDLIVLPASSKIGSIVEDGNGNPVTDGQGNPLIWGISKPLEDGDVLVDSERVAIANATAAYNTTIKDIANNDANLALMDANALMAQVGSANGYSFGSGKVTAAFGTGGAFSLDGVHPTQRGYALIANAIIDAIENQFGATLPKLEPMEYPTIFLDPNGP